MNGKFKFGFHEREKLTYHHTQGLKNGLIFAFLLLLTLIGIWIFSSFAPSPPEYVIDYLVSIHKLTISNQPRKICDDMNLQFLISGILPSFLGGRNDKLGTVKTLWTCAQAYQELYPGYTLASFMITYISMQAFAIPGPIVLSILAGALFPFFWAQVIVATCATSGASVCFLLSYFYGKGVVNRLFSKPLEQFTMKIQDNTDSLFYYLLFLRVTPLLPNWFVNIASPMVGVPLRYFVAATFVGLVPANFFHISTGLTLTKLGAGESTGENNTWMFLVLFGLQFVALLPTLFKQKIKRHFKE